MVNIMEFHNKISIVVWEWKAESFGDILYSPKTLDLGLLYLNMEFA